MDAQDNAWLVLANPNRLSDLPCEEKNYTEIALAGDLYCFNRKSPYRAVLLGRVGDPGLLLTWSRNRRVWWIIRNVPDGCDRRKNKSTAKYAS
jgi:hypothetical protein